MNSESIEPVETTPAEAEDGLITQAWDVATEMMTGIPAPVRKNAFKAFGQLCTAAVDIPVAYLEGRAKEIRALSDRSACKDNRIQRRQNC